MVSYQIIRPVKLLVRVSLPAFAWKENKNKLKGKNLDPIMQIT